MPEFTIYAKIRRLGKRTHKIKNTPVHRLHDFPTSWPDLKDTLIEVAKQIYLDQNGQTETEISLDRHLAGKYKMGMQNYRDSRIRINRIPEFKAKIIYNHRLGTIKIKSATFLTSDFFERYKFDFDFDIKKKWKLKPVIDPATITELLDPEARYRNLLNIKTPNYDPMPIGIYGSQQERHQSIGCYEAIPHGVYGAANDRTLERDEAIKQSRIKR
jgi:hypothetical protein